MKKLIIFSTVLLSCFMIAQNKIANVYSTSELQNMQNSVPANEQELYYVQYLKAKLFENIKSNFNSKKYSDNMLKKFTDSIISQQNVGWDDDLQTNLEAKPLTFEEYSAFEKDKEARGKKAVEEAKKMKGFDKKTTDLMSKLLESMDYEKTGDIKKDYENYIDNFKKSIENNIYSAKNRQMIITKLNDAFAKKNYNSEETEELLVKNFSPNYNNFPYPVSKHDGEAEIYEVVKDDILAFGVTSGVVAGTYENYYKIDSENIIPISVYPYEDKNFDKKVSKYAKKGFRFEPSAGAEIKKINNEYFITTMLYKDEDFMTFASLLIEYKTKDFKNFTPLKIANNEENPKWKIIK